MRPSPPSPAAFSTYGWTRGLDGDRFTAPSDARLGVDETPDIISTIDRFSPYQLPAQVAGLQGGAATYGNGYALVAVLPLHDRLAFSTLRRLSEPPGQVVEISGARAAALVTPLLSILIVVGQYQSFLIAGTVPPATLVAAGQDLTRAALPMRPQP